MARFLRHRLRWTVSRRETVPVWSALRNLRWAAPRISKCVCRTPTWPDISATSGNLPGTASTCCMTFLKARFRWHLHYREGVSGNPRRSRANHTSGCSHCTTVHRCITVQWMFRSNTSSILCTMSHDRIYHTASRSDREIWAHWLEFFHRSNLPSTGSRIPR